MIRHLEAELVARVALPRKQFFDVRVVDEEVEDAAVVAEVFGHRRPVEDLVVARILAEVRAADDGVARPELLELRRDFEAAARHGFEERVVELRDVEVAEHEQVVVLDVLALEARVDPVGQHLQLGPAPVDAVAPARVHGDGEEVEVARAERAHVRGTPEGLRGQKLGALLDARRVDLGREPVEDDRAPVEEKGRALLVPAVVVDPVGVDELPGGAEEAHHLRHVFEVVAQLDQRDEVELVEYLGDVMECGQSARLLAELADVPDGDVDGLVELRRRNLRSLDALLEDEEPCRDFGGNLAVMHLSPPGVGRSVWRAFGRMREGGRLYITVLPPSRKISYRMIIKSYKTSRLNC